MLLAQEWWDFRLSGNRKLLQLSNREIDEAREGKASLLIKICISCLGWVWTWSLCENSQLPSNIQLENTNLKSWERKVMELRNTRTGVESKCSARQSEEERSEEHLQNVAFPSLDHSSISVFSHYVLITETSRQLTKACVYFLSFNLWMYACGCVTVCLRVFYYCIQGKEAVSKFPSSSSSSSFSSSCLTACCKVVSATLSVQSEA